MKLQIFKTNFQVGRPHRLTQVHDPLYEEYREEIYSYTDGPTVASIQVNKGKSIKRASEVCCLHSQQFRPQSLKRFIGKGGGGSRFKSRASLGTLGG